MPVTTKSVKPSTIEGRIEAPPSKSMMQRAVAAALLSEGTSEIRNPSFCADALAAIEVAEGLGATVDVNDERLLIRGGMKPVGRELNCGESGLCLRMFTPIAGLNDRLIHLLARGTLSRRPVKMMEEPLRNLGVSCTTAGGFPPVGVQGPLLGGDAVVDGAVGSQFLTGLLMALPKAEKPSRIRVTKLKSKPYIDMTINMLKNFGITVVHQNYETFLIDGGQTFLSASLRIEGDWSAASFLLAAGALAGRIEVGGLDTDSAQADRLILDALAAFGAKVVCENKIIRVEKNDFKAFTFDATDAPDLFPPITALACFGGGTSRIKGVHRLLHKESDRAAALVREFTAIGGNIRIKDDWLEITGGPLSGGTVDSHQDHRIAMAAAAAAVATKNGVVIKDCGCTAKSYPGFFNDIKKIGVQIHE